MNKKMGLIREIFATIQDWYGLHYNARNIRNGRSLLLYVPFLFVVLCTLPFVLLLGHRRNCKCKDAQYIIRMNDK